MVKVTTNYLIRRITFRKQLQVRKKDETDKQYLNRITHLRLQSQFIDQIAKVTDCQSVLVIYLQNNLLKTIHGMENFPNLIHLYLQRNLLTKIENLDVLTQLKKIYLGYNGILVLEGLENLTNLTEIHIENQNLPLGETLLFEPRTIQNLAATLQFLNVSSNNLTTLSGLENLVSLEVLIANDNLLSNLNDVTRTLAAWPFLKRLNLIGNLVTEERKYRDSVIVASKRLEILDNKPILVTTRKFIEKLIELQKSREEKKTVPEKALRKKEAKTDKDIRTVQFSRIFENEDNFPNLAEILPPLELSDLHPAWKLRANLNPVNPKKCLPRPYWKKAEIHKSLSVPNTVPLQVVTFD